MPASAAPEEWHLLGGKAQDTLLLGGAAPDPIFWELGGFRRMAGLGPAEKMSPGDSRLLRPKRGALWLWSLPAATSCPAAFGLLPAP